MDMGLSANDFEPLRTHNFDITFESDTMTDENLKLLTLLVREIVLPDWEFRAIKGNHRKHFIIRFMDLVRKDVLTLVKQLAMDENLIIRLRIFDPCGIEVYHPIVLTDCVFNYFNLGILSYQDGGVRTIEVKLNALTKPEDYIRK